MEMATKIAIKTMDEQDKMITNIAESGSTWTKIAPMKAGQSRNDRCDLCGETEKADHVWTCKALDKHRKQIDVGIARLKPGKLLAAVKQAVAPAMVADITKPFWGGEEMQEESKDDKKLCGCDDGVVTHEMKKIMVQTTEQHTAKKIMRGMLE